MRSTKSSPDEYKKKMDTIVFSKRLSHTHKKIQLGFFFRRVGSVAIVGVTSSRFVLVLFFFVVAPSLLFVPTLDWFHKPTVDEFWIFVFPIFKQPCTEEGTLFVGYHQRSEGKVPKTNSNMASHKNHTFCNTENIFMIDIEFGLPRTWVSGPWVVIVTCFACN